jgi:DNA-binding beta-propeller fold protein YncE
METPENAPVEYHYTYEVVEVPRRNRKWLLVLAVVLLVLAFGGVWLVAVLTAPTGTPSQQDLAGITWVRSIYGWGPAKDQRLERPVDAAFDRDGSVWIVDGQNSRIVRVRPDNALVGMVQFQRGAGRGQAKGLQSVDVGADGSLYVTDAVRGVVMKLDQSGKLLREWSVPSAGDVSVRGSEVAVTGSQGWTVFTTDGQRIRWSWTDRGKGLQQLDLPRGILLGKKGTVYVADTGNARVKAFDGSGKLLWVSNGPHRDTFDTNTGEPTGFTPPSRDDTGGAGIETMQTPVGLALDARGRLVVVDALDFSLWVLDPKHEGAFVGHYGAEGQGDGAFRYPTNLSYDASRDWFAVADTYNGRVQIVRIPGSGGSPLAAARRISVPKSVCLLPFLALIATVAVLVRFRRVRDSQELMSVHQAPRQVP